MTFLHWMGEGSAKRYRVWSTVSDTYYGPPMTEAELAVSGLVVWTEEPAEVQLAKWERFGNGQMVQEWWREQGPEEALA